MEWLHATNAEMNWVDYASQVVFELLYDDQCLLSANDNTCFRVNVIWNGHPLAFRECALSALPDGTGCSYDDFVDHMNNIWYDGVDADNLNQACYQTMKPYGDATNYFQ